MVRNKIEKYFSSKSNDVITVWNTYLLVLISVLLFVLPIFTGPIGRLASLVVFSTIFIGIGFVLIRHRHIVFGLALLAFVTEWVAHLADIKLLQEISEASTILLFVYVVLQLISQIVRSKKVNTGVILGAINGYLLTGLVFSLVISFVYNIDPQAFGFKGQDLTFNDFSYFGFVTFSTLGYGDITPLKPLTRSLSILITITGQIYLTVIIALLVGKYASESLSNKPDRKDVNTG